MLAAPAPAAASAASDASSGTMARARTDGSETPGGFLGADASRTSRDTENGKATETSAGSGAAASKSQRKRSVPKRATAGRPKVRLDPSPAPAGPRRKKRAGQPPVGSAKKKQNVGPRPLSAASASAPHSCLRRPASQSFQHRHDVAADTDAAKKSVSFVSPSKGQVEVREFEMWQKPAGCAGCQRSVEGDAYVTCDRCEKNYHLDCCTPVSCFSAVCCHRCRHQLHCDMS